MSLVKPTSTNTSFSTTVRSSTTLLALPTQKFLLSGPQKPRPRWSSWNNYSPLHPFWFILTQRNSLLSRKTHLILGWGQFSSSVLAFFPLLNSFWTQLWCARPQITGSKASLGGLAARHPFIISTDHYNLTYLRIAKRLNVQHAQWSLFFGCFSFSISPSFQKHKMLPVPASSPPMLNNGNQETSYHPNAKGAPWTGT